MKQQQNINKGDDKKKIWNLKTNYIKINKKYINVAQTCNHLSNPPGKIPYKGKLGQ